MAEASVGSSEDRHRNTPDPSTATIDTLRREIAHLSDRIDLKIEGQEKTFCARLDAVVRAAELAHADLVRFPTAIQESIACEHAWTAEKFEGVSLRLDGMAKLKDEQFRAIGESFALRDVRVAESARDTKIAVDAALSAAEKATAKGAENSAETAAKSEAALAKQADQQAELFRTTTGALQSQINEMKTQITRIESIAIGQAGQKTETHTSQASTVSIIVVGLSILSALIAVSAFLKPH